MRVLVVEDDDVTRDAISRFLSSSGHKVDAAPDQASAVEAARRLRPDVVVCDWQLGDESADGVRVAAEMHQQYAAAVILMTAREIADLRKRAEKLEVAHFLRKPISLFRLIGIINSLKKSGAP